MNRRAHLEHLVAMIHGIGDDLQRAIATGDEGLITDELRIAQTQLKAFVQPGIEAALHPEAQSFPGTKAPRVEPREKRRRPPVAHAERPEEDLWYRRGPYS